jgi:cytochrome P450
MTTHPPLPTARPLLDPAPEYAKWQAEEPIRRVALWGDTSPWVITRHEHARAVLSDARFSSDGTRDGYPTMRPQPTPRTPGQIFMMDGADHNRLRRMLISDFTHRRVEGLHPSVTLHVGNLIDTMTADGATEADLVEAYALPLPSLVICELLGVPYEDHAFFQQQARTFLTIATSPQEAMAARAHLYDYLGELLARRTEEPADDLLSRLATERVATGQATVEEAVGVSFVLLLGGHETTANMIALSTVALLRDPAQLAALRADPALWPGAVDELLRYLTVVHSGMRRVATEDVEVGGVLIRAGEGVIVPLQAANRDPDVYPDPDRLDVTRDASRHLAFGHGAHHCVGESLARAELGIALPALFDRLPGLRLTAGPEDFAQPLSPVHGVRSLPVAW